MAFVMVFGYPLLLLTAIPSFQQIFLGQQSAQGATQGNVDDAREQVVKLRCGSKKPPTGDRLDDCKKALEELGAGYQALSYPSSEEQAAGEFPPNSEQNLEKSLEAFKLLVQVDPDDEESQEFLAGAYSQQQMYSQAMPIYQSLLEDDPDNADLVYALANSAQASGDTEQAIASYKRFVKLAPEDQRAETAQETIKELENPEAAQGGNLPISVG
jgi:tetratricopeptide (TPR) repeat protein